MQKEIVSIQVLQCSCLKSNRLYIQSQLSVNYDPSFTLLLYCPSFIFVIVCGLFEWRRICAGFIRLFIYVLPLVIQLSRGEG